MTWRGAEASRAPAHARTGAEFILPALAPLLFLVPVALGIMLSVVRLVQVRYPAYGWTLNVDSDAQAMAFGISPFQDPAHGYTGNAYTPLYPFLASLPDHLYRWSGWSVLITIAAGVGCAAIVARLAYRNPAGPGRRWRALAIAEAAGVGALGWSLVYGLRQNGLVNAQNDQLTWLAALAAIVLVPAAARGGRAARIAIVVLVSAAFWAKQPGIIAAVAVLAGLAAAVATGRMRARDLIAMAAATVALNAVLLAGLDLITHGWALRWLFEIDLPAIHGVGFAVRTLFPRVCLALAVTGALGALAGVAARRDATALSRRLVASDDGLIVISLGALALLGAAEGIYLLRFAAGADNDAMALSWGLGALAAVAYRRAGTSRDPRLIAGLVCAVVALMPLSDVGEWGLRRGVALPAESYAAIPDPVANYAKTHLTYHTGIPLSFLRGRDGAYPTIVHIREDLTRGETPWHLVHALVERRFAAVFGLFSPDPTDLAPPALNPGEHNFWWKLNLVIEANYRPDPGAPAIPAGFGFLSQQTVPMRIPRRSPPALWLVRCFGPFTIGAIELRIHEGGGLWCREGGSTLAMRGTPARASQVESTRQLSALGGQLDVATGRAAGWWSVELEGAWRLRADVTPERGVRLTLTDGGRARAVTTIPASDLHQSRGRIRLRFEATSGAAAIVRTPRSLPTLRVRVPAEKSGTLALWSSADLGTRFELGGLRTGS